MKLKLQIGSTLADLRDDVDIPVVLRSPLFADGKGSFIFNFRLPATPAIKAEMGNFHRPGSLGAAYISKEMILEFGPLKFRGTATISEADEENYEVSCPVDAGDFASLLKQAKLTGLDLGGDRQLLSDQVVAEMDAPFTYYDMASPDPFSETVVPEFSEISANSGLLNLAGTALTVSVQSSLKVTFDIRATVLAGLMKFRVFVDAVQEAEWDLTDNVVKVLNFVDFTGVITWELYVQNSDGVTPGTYDLDATLSGSTSLIVIPIGSLNAFLERYPTTDFVLFPIENDKMLDNTPDDKFGADHLSLKDAYNKYFPVMNYYLNGDFPPVMEGVTPENEFVTLFNLINPQVYLAYVIKQIAKHFNFSIDNNVFEDADLRQLVIFSAFAENNFVAADKIGPVETFDLKNHVPDAVISEYFAELCKLLGIGYDYNSYTRTLRLKYLKDVATDTNYEAFPGILSDRPVLKADPYNGYKYKLTGTGDAYATDKFKSLDGLTYKGTIQHQVDLGGITAQKINDCWLVLDNNDYWYWNYDEEVGQLGWMFYSRNFFFYHSDTDTTINDNSLEIQPKVMPLMINGKRDPDPQLCADVIRYWVIPKTSQPGNFAGLPPKFKTDFSWSLCLYLGLRNDGNFDAEVYPLASNDIRDYNGNLCAFAEPDGFTPGLSLNWTGADGLYEKRYKQWINLLVGSRGFWKVNAWITPLQLSEIDILKWYTNAEYRFLIKEMRFNLRKYSISKAEMEILIK